MGSLAFGQPIGGIIQMAYTVPDIEAAATGYVEKLGIGPWFVRGPFVPPAGLYRGAPTAVSLSLAISFSGHMMIELIQQHDEAPSVYREIIERRGHGFHHWGVASDRFDEDVARYRANGYSVAFSDRTPVGTRVAYFDTSADLPGMIELIEIDDLQNDRYGRLHAATVDWDGSAPLRRL
jgi:hypothetical protein